MTVMSGLGVSDVSLQSIFTCGIDRYTYTQRVSSCPNFLALSPLEVADFKGSPYSLFRFMFKWMEKSAKKLKLAKFGLNSDNAPEITRLQIRMVIHTD